MRVLPFNSSAAMSMYECDLGHHFLALPDHPTANGQPLCPHCMHGNPTFPLDVLYWLLMYAYLASTSNEYIDESQKEQICDNLEDVTTRWMCETHAWVDGFLPKFETEILSAMKVSFNTDLVDAWEVKNKNEHFCVLNSEFTTQAQLDHWLKSGYQVIGLTRKRS